MMEELSPLGPKDCQNRPLFLERFTLDQVKAATHTLQVIRKIPGVLTDPSLKAVRETDVFRLRRGLCLPCAVATCINTILGRRLIGDEEGNIRVGDIYDWVIPFHNKTDLTNLEGEAIDLPWWVATKQGDVYHHALVAVSLGLGVPAMPIIGFSSLEVISDFLAEGGAMALSLDNSFVLEETLGKDPRFVSYVDGKARILIEGPDGTSFRSFEQGRHVVSLVGSNNEGELLISDSFRLPQMDGAGLIMSLPRDRVEKYLKYAVDCKARAIAFAEDESLFASLESFINWPAVKMIPGQVVDFVSGQVASSFPREE